jgi:transcriptional regulator of met regulon
MVYDDKVSSFHTLEDDEQLVDNSSSPEQMNFEINMIHLFVDGSVPTEEDLVKDRYDEPERGE